MKHVTTRMVFSYWDSLRGERAAPERGEIEPGEIRHVLADTFILELGAARAAEIRLAGTRLCAFFGRELKGYPFHRLWAGDATRDVIHLIDVVVDETAGVVAGLVGQTDEGDRLDFEMVLLPLRHRGKTHSRLLGAISPAIVPNWIGLHPIVAFETTSLRVIWPSGRESEIATEVASSAVEAQAEERRRHFVVHPGGRPS
jgi:hypothetical protein